MNSIKLLIVVFLLGLLTPISAKADSNTDLLSAAKKGNIELAMSLLSKGANANIIDKSGFTPLIYAATKGHLDVIIALILRDASVNIKNKYGGTALMYAAGNGHISIVKYLIEKGAKVKAVAFDGDSALKIAKRKGYKKLPTSCMHTERVNEYRFIGG